ncbi:BRCT domain-containing protein [Tenacibaculum finnmarkense genomovar ulcerans]|uniref:BRCT domain-containing protein n=1 Tax=Tenacibaculum finnmarkense TaxID=2781243 RepID=UPI001E551AD8|nr:BRCT domain-containing protein [Tenacibaculum finnmarkense]MCD8431004.1 BRCT domain-containing protein [Tenacibaculum finnmarkense genomovar ulcerans]
MLVSKKENPINRYINSEKENSTQKKAANFNKKEFQYKVNLLNSNFLSSFSANEDCNFKLDINDDENYANVIIDNQTIGKLNKRLFDEVRFYLNNPEYVTQSQVEIKTINKIQNLFILITVLKTDLANEILNKVEPTEEESTSYAKSFAETDFMELKSTEFDSKYLYPRKDLEPNGHLFYGKKVVITGGMESFPFREELAKLLWEIGADVDRAIGKNTDFAIVGSYNVGPRKMDKIIAQGIRIIREKELLEIFPNRMLNRKKNER